MAEKRTYADRREYLIRAVKRRRQKIRELTIDYMGGRCTVCGYDRCKAALELHHLDSSKKDFGISDRGYTRSWAKVEEEIKKCVLLCANCHRELHARLQLSVERRIENSGEFREPYTGESLLLHGNPERSLPKGVNVGRNVQRLGNEDPIQ